MVTLYAIVVHIMPLCLRCAIAVFIDTNICGLFVRRFLALSSLCKDTRVKAFLNLRHGSGINITTWFSSHKWTDFWFVNSTVAAEEIRPDLFSGLALSRPASQAQGQHTATLI